MIDVNIGNQAPAGDTEPSPIKVSFDNFKSEIKVEITHPKVASFKLNARSTMNGDIMIFDHNDIDIMILSEKKKVVAFAKDLMSEVVYGTEARLFEHLKKKGLVEYDSIQGGNVYGSLEGKLLQSKKFDVIKLTLKNISEWLLIEKPNMDGIEYFERMEEEWLTEPNAEDSTEFDPRRQSPEKGSINPWTSYSVNNGNYYYEE
jgi:hypothetical protein